MHEHSRKRTLLAAAAVAAVLGLTLAGCGSSGGSDNAGSSPSAAAPGSKGKVTVVQAGYTENNILAQIYTQILEKNGYDVTVKTVPNRETYSPGLEKGTVDVVPDYLGSAADYYQAQKTKNPDATIATSDVQKTLTDLQDLTKSKGLTILNPSTATDQTAFAVTKDYASQNKLTTLSDLAASGKSVVLAAPQECPSRPLCGVALEKTYKIDVSKYLPFPFDSPTAKKQVTDGKAQLVLVATTDAQLDKDGLVVLTDDKKVQPAENLVPIVGKGSPIATDATVVAALNRANETLTTADLGALDAKVDVDREKAADVAKEYLESKNLI
jgi:osmoprotectant transport system substrate-binding protein